MAITLELTSTIRNTLVEHHQIFKVKQKKCVSMNCNRKTIWDSWTTMDLNIIVIFFLLKLN